MTCAEGTAIYGLGSPQSGLKTKDIETSALREGGHVTKGWTCILKVGQRFSKFHWKIHKRLHAVPPVFN